MYAYNCGCRLARAIHLIGIYGIHTVFLARKSSYIRSNAVHICGSGQPCVNALTQKALCDRLKGACLIFKLSGAVV
jgi:hypothetical protein